MTSAERESVAWYGERIRTISDLQLSMMSDMLGLNGTIERAPSPKLQAWRALVAAELVRRAAIADTPPSDSWRTTDVRGVHALR